MGHFMDRKHIRADQKLLAGDLKRLLAALLCLLMAFSMTGGAAWADESSDSLIYALVELDPEEQDGEASEEPEAGSEEPGSSEEPEAASEEPESSAELFGEDVSPSEEPPQSLEAVVDDILILVETESSPLPVGATLEAELVDDRAVLRAAEDAAVEDVLGSAGENTVIEDVEIVQVQAVAITIYDSEGEVVSPQDLKVTVASRLITEAEESPVVVQMDERGDVLSAASEPVPEPVPESVAAEPAPEPGAESTIAEPDPLPEDIAEEEQPLPEDAVVFSADPSAAVYAIVSTRTLSREFISSGGDTYTVTVTYGPEAELPPEAALSVEELLPDPEGTDGGAPLYEEYVEKAQYVLGWEEGSPSYIRLFDIRIVDESGEKLEIAAPVEVKIELTDKAGKQDTQIVHFADDAETGDVVENVVVEAAEDAEEGVALSFQAEGFSVYAIVEAPEPVGVRNAASLAELSENTAESFILCRKGKNPMPFFSSELNGNRAFIEVTDVSLAAAWRFVPAEGENRYRICTVVDGAEKYIRNTSGNYAGFTDAAGDGTVFELSQAGAESFYFKIAGQNKWLQYSNGGGGIRFWTDRNSAVNSQITISYASSYFLPEDPYGLDGTTHGIVYHNNTASAAALTAEGRTVGSSRRLAGQELLIRPDVLDNEGVLLVAENSDITEWTFRWVQDDLYRITAEIDGQTVYLSIDGANVVLTDSPDEVNSLIRAEPGTGEYSGKWRFSVNGRLLNYFGSAGNGFGGADRRDTTWMNLTKRSVLTDDDFNLYTAEKVSVTDDESVYQGQYVVIYTRLWNETTKRYEFYAVDHDGSLVRCYDAGNNIEWIGSRVNTALWEFTEYTYDDGTPNHYYELQNVQYGSYIAPQAGEGPVLSEEPIGINLNGRRFGENYTTIIAWDDDNYRYAGLKIENGRVAACALAEAQDFYFALVTREEETGELTTVATVDNDLFGISIRMQNYAYQNHYLNGQYRQADQADILGFDSNGPGILKSYLEADGYPLAAYSQQSLSALYGAASPANHLFLQSIYNESGYFEFDSTKNYAYLAGGDFIVYDQLGTNQSSNTYSALRAHGMFMPYNDLAGKHYSTVLTNMTDIYGSELPDMDPRKGERLYQIEAPYPGQNGKPAPGNADYFFGMEMEAAFTQTASGLDDWGHDIIFEFSGDDDFWLYVDGVLILDIGGVHSAQSGDVNFRTGEVNCRGTRTTLRALFETAYRAQNPQAGNEAVTAYLDEIFGVGGTVFKDYTNHTMKMFYMERGAGSSNLHMRFNLAAVKPGTFLLSKKLSGAENAENDLIEFPYQIWYESENDMEMHLLGALEGEAERVTYEGTGSAVKYAERFTAPGGDSYDNVFFLKPGQSAEVDLPDDARTYFVVECGVDPRVYDRVAVNGEVLTGDPGRELEAAGGRKDYRTSPDTMENRSEVEFDNHVSEGAMGTLFITKRLFDADGQTVLRYPDSRALFSIRLYLGSETAAGDHLPPANLYSYCIKDAEGHYCRWDTDAGGFVSLDATTFDALLSYFAQNSWTDAQKETVIFKTSMNGSISKIPAGYTVEVRGLIAGTQWMVEEWDGEIPKGYTRRDSDGYALMTDPAVEQHDPISGTIRIGEDPVLEIRNQKGWGLTVEKVWADEDFMEVHDSVYFAVYLDGELMEGTVRQLQSGQTNIYYFFDDLYDRYHVSHPFSDYTVREVTISNPEPSVENGVVTDPGEVTPIGDNGTLTLGGRPAGGEYRTGYVYSVRYETGEMTGHNENIRTDRVTNSRPGIALYKTDWQGANLAGAVFSLRTAQRDENGDPVLDEAGQIVYVDVAAPTYTSGSDGRITRAYLSDGEYILTELSAPKGYAGLSSPVTILVDGDQVTLSGADPELVTLETGGEGSDDALMTGVIRIRNRTNALRIRKINLQNEPVPDVHFALYRQVTDIDGNKVRNYWPEPGYEDIVSDGDGVLPGFDAMPNPGTYYLSEFRTPTDYAPLTEDLRFTVSPNGEMTLLGIYAEEDWLTVETDDESGCAAYVLTIPNGKVEESIQLLKLSVEREEPLAGVGFKLYDAASFDEETGRVRDGAESIFSGATDENGILFLGERFPVGNYYLVETDPLDGYLPLDKPICITVSNSGVTAQWGVSSCRVVQEDNSVWQITVYNNPGIEMPATGGAGTAGTALLGALMVLGASGPLLCRLLRRRKKYDLGGIG